MQSPLPGRRRARAAAALALCLALTAAVAAPSLAAAASPLIVTLPSDVSPQLARASALAVPAGWSAQPMQATVVLHRTDPAGFFGYLRGVMDPRSPEYRHFLTPAQQAAAFGPSASAYDAVLADLEGYGLTLAQGSANRLTLTVAGSRAQVEAAFHVSVDPYEFAGRQVYANAGAPAVDAAIRPFVADVTGLSDLTLPKASIQKAPAAAQILTPMQIAQAYGFGALRSTGAGQTIGLVEFDSFHPTDVTDWLAYEGLPATLANNVTVIPIGAGAGAPTGDTGEGEVLLDIDTVLGAAPGAHVDVFEAPQAASFAQVFQTMLADGVTVISNSWYSCEADTRLASAQAINSVLASAAAAGVSVFSSAGDSGPVCNDGTADSVGVAVPADSPYATAVGGTTLSVDGSGNYAGETWWGQSCPVGALSCGSGGYGTSQFFSIPSWQQPFEPSQTQRSVPDVSADASPNTGIAICQADNSVGEGCGQVVGGTSLATPIWAAAMALLNQRYGAGTNLNAALYARAGTGFHTPASMGSDFSHVGLGSPDLATLSFAKPTSVQVQVSRLNVPEGQGATVSGVVYGGYPSNIPMAGETVDLTATAGTLGTPTATTASDGTFTSSFTAPSTAGVVTLTASVSGTSITGTAPLTVNVGPPASVSVAPAAPSVGAGQQVTISGTVRDSGGNPVGGVAVDLAAGAGSIAGSPVTTSGDGTYSATFTAPGSEGPVTLTASLQSGVTGSGVVNVTAGPAAGITATASPSQVSLGGQTTVSGSVYDAFGNAVGGATVDVAPSAGVAAAASVTTAANGQFSDTIAGLGQSGPASVAATVAGTSLHATASMTVAQPAVSVSVSPSPVRAGATATVTGAVYDSAGQPVARAIVSLTASAGTLGSLTAMTDAGGGFSTTLTAPASAQAVTVTASENGSANSAVVLVVPASVSVAASGSGTSLTPGGAAAVSVANARALATGGTGTLSLAQYAQGGNPAAAASFSATGVYFDVSLSAGATFTGVTVSECDGAASGQTVYWWNGKTWAAVTPAATYGGGCLTLDINGSSSPSLADLGGTPFGVAAYVPPTTVTSSSGGGGGASKLPAVSQINPTSGPAAGGTAVTIDGSGFTGVTAVDFGATPAASFTVLPPNVIDAVSPPGAGTVDITVTTAGGTSTISAADHFTYAASGPAPVVSGLAPTGGPTGGGTAVQLTGTGFTGATAVSFGGNPATFSVVADGVIDAVAPAGSGTVDVRVTTPNGPSAPGPGDQYTYVPVTAPVFSDVPATYWAYGPIEALAAQGILSGFPDGTFRPDAPVTRAEFVKMLDLTLDLPTPAASTSAFTDVKPGDWFSPYVAAATADGLVKGVAPGVFDPQGLVTREEMAVLLARARHLSGGPPLKFSDAQRIAPWAAPGVQAAVAAGLLQGFPGGAFDPLGDATRAQAARVLALILLPPGASG